MFYFAWADASEPFSETTHSVEDEQIFSFRISHEEGEFPALELTIRNPRIGLLGPGRKRWCWLSMDGEPLFYGVLVGIPQKLQDELVQLDFVARPLDFVAQKVALANTLAVTPYWDALFVPAEERSNPDRVLDGYTRLWHIDRTTLVVTASDILAGEDGTLTITQDDAFYDALDVHVGQEPLRRIDVSAEVAWEQKASGTVDITARVVNAINDASPSTSLSDVDGVHVWGQNNTIHLLGAKGMIQAWPKSGAGIGGGWQVGYSQIGIAGSEGDGDLSLGASSIGSMTYEQRRNIYGGAGVLFSVSPLYTHDYDTDTQMLWIPALPVAPVLNVDYSTTRQYTESLSFSLVADVQPLLTDAAGDDVEELSFASARVDDLISGALPIVDVRRRSFFKTDRGLQAINNLLMRARASLLARARAIEVTTRFPFADGLDLSLRQSAVIEDYRLPGGQAGGKIIKYELVFDGDSGDNYTSLTIGCTPGYGGTISTVVGAPTYVDATYCDDYQEYTHHYVMPSGSDVGYDAIDIYNTAIGDDGKDMYQIDSYNSVLSIDVTGGLDEQMSAASGAAAYGPRNVQRAIRGVKTSVTVNLRPLTGGPFTTAYSVTPSELQVPQTIDLEAV